MHIIIIIISSPCIHRRLIFPARHPIPQMWWGRINEREWQRKCWLCGKCPLDTNTETEEFDRRRKSEEKFSQQCLRCIFEQKRWQKKRKNVLYVEKKKYLKMNEIIQLTSKFILFEKFKISQYKKWYYSWRWMKKISLKVVKALKERKWVFFSHCFNAFHLHTHFSQFFCWRSKKLSSLVLKLFYKFSPESKHFFSNQKNFLLVHIYFVQENR
jgi:hypothetical protein